VTHDEALTYLRYVAGSWRGTVGRFDSNNHILGSVLCKLSVGAFGLSLPSLRAPALAGTALFLLSMGRLARVVAGEGSGAFVLCGLTTLNPLVIRVMPVARGYSLALGLFGLALLLLLPREGSSKTRDFLAAGALALSVAANLTFAFPCAGAAAGTVLLRRRKLENRRTLDRVVVAASLAAIAAVLSLELLRPGTLHRAQKSNYYLGASTAAQSLRLLLGGSIGSAAASETALIAAGLLAVALAAMFLAALARPEPAPAAILTGSALFAGGAALMALHVALGLPLPQGRTGLAYVVLFPLAWAACAEVLPHRVRRPLLAISAVAGGLIVAVFIRHDLRVNWGIPDSRAMVRAIESSGCPMPCRVSASWFLAPNLEFSRRLVRSSRLAPIAYRSPICTEGFDAYALFGSNEAIAAQKGLPIAYRDTESGAVIALAGPPSTSGTSRPQCPPAKLSETWP
jgi:hypothetical protein